MESIHAYQSLIESRLFGYADAYTYTRHDRDYEMILTYNESAEYGV